MKWAPLIRSSILDVYLHANTLLLKMLNGSALLAYLDLVYRKLDFTFQAF